MSKGQDAPMMVFGDPLVQVSNSGAVCAFTGERAASDPFEVLPGAWQVAVRSRHGDVMIQRVEGWRVANVPNHVLELLIDDAGESSD